MVEHHLAKVDVEGSNPFSRSNPPLQSLQIPSVLLASNVNSSHKSAYNSRISTAGMGYVRGVPLGNSPQGRINMKGLFLVAVVFLMSCATDRSVLHEEVVAATENSYYFADHVGQACLTAYSLAENNVTSRPSNKVCKDAPARWLWEKPTKNEDGSDIGHLVGYKLVFTLD